jgi:hypothetical protein
MSFQTAVHDNSIEIAVAAAAKTETELDEEICPSGTHVLNPLRDFLTFCATGPRPAVDIRRHAPTPFLLPTTRLRFITFQKNAAPFAHARGVEELPILIENNL